MIEIKKIDVIIKDIKIIFGIDKNSNKKNILFNK